MIIKLEATPHSLYLILNWLVNLRFTTFFTTIDRTFCLSEIAEMAVSCSFLADSEQTSLGHRVATQNRWKLKFDILGAVFRGLALRLFDQHSAWQWFEMRLWQRHVEGQKFRRNWNKQRCTDWLQPSDMHIYNESNIFVVFWVVLRSLKSSFWSQW